MRIFAFIIPSLLAYASSTNAFTYLVENYCTRNVFLTFGNQSYTSNASQLDSGTAYISEITTDNNIVAVTNTSDYWSPDTSKLVWGMSSSGGTIWWSINDVDGDPMAPGTFNVTSDGPNAAACGDVTGYNATDVRSCGDDGSVLTMNLCSTNQ